MILTLIVFTITRDPAVLGATNTVGMTACAIFLYYFRRNKQNKEEETGEHTPDPAQ
jgi:hypothetical protein